jgi:hypothetical protein
MNIAPKIFCEAFPDENKIMNSLLRLIKFAVKQKNFIKLTSYISFAQIMWTTCY